MTVLEELGCEKIDFEGTWSDIPGRPGWYAYQETEQESIWTYEMDRQYLFALIKQDSNKFLEEMTPNPAHNGICVGLDLNHPHHMALQKEFQYAVDRLCKEKGLTEHPALLEQPLDQTLLGGASKQNDQDIKEQQEGKDELETTVLKQYEKNKQPEELTQQGIQQLTNSKNTLQSEQPSKTHIPRSSWLRIWEGKNAPAGKLPKYTPVSEKPQGCAVGFMAKTPKGKQYLAKLGLPDEANEIAPSLSTRKHNYQRSIISVITEKIGADVYAVLGHGFYYVPKHRLARLKILNPFTENRLDAITISKKINQKRKADDQITEGVHLLSRWIKQYQDIDTLLRCLRSKDDTEPKTFLACLTAGYVPEYVIIEEQIVPILGLMEVLAASRLLADTDVLGGGGKNAGFVIERSSEGLPLAVRMVKVDAGEAFNFSGEHNQLTQSFNPISTATKLKNGKDLQFGNQQPITIPWSGLADRQRNAFLQSLKRGLALLGQEALVDFFIYRQGEFDRAVIGKRSILIDKVVHPFKEAWLKYQAVQTMPQIYGDVITQAEAVAPSAVPFQPKLYGAVNHRANEAISLSRGNAGN